MHTRPPHAGCTGASRPTSPRRCARGRRGLWGRGATHAVRYIRACRSAKLHLCPCGAPMRVSLYTNTRRNKCWHPVGRRTGGT
eukprot:8686330-Lingulodinium_polyedra.AAC.1